MKVILIKDVLKLGSTGEIKEVSSGYARNYLLPKSLAQIATPDGLNLIEGKARVKDRKEKERRLKGEKILGKLKGKIFTFKKKANAEGHLFASLHENEIIDKIENEVGLKLKKQEIILVEPVKKLGQARLKVVLSPEESCDLVINIEKE